MQPSAEEYEKEHLEAIVKRINKDAPPYEMEKLAGVLRKYPGTKTGTIP